MEKNKISIDKQKTMETIRNLSEECINCGKCKGECSLLSGFSVKPGELFKNLLEDRKIDPLIPYSCNTCSLCLKVCPKNLNIGDAFLEIRKELAEKNGGTSPLKGHNSVHLHQKLSFSSLFNKVIKDEKVEKVTRIFMPGCSLCSYSPELVFKTFEYLKEKLPGTAMVIKCCGKPTAAIGEGELFKNRYEKLQRTIEELNVEEIITACQSCFVTISENSPKLKVKSLWTVFKELGIPESSRNIGKDSDIVFAIHDSCPTRDEKELQDSVRWIIDQLGYKVEESEHSKEKTRCCGNGGMVFTVNRELTSKVVNKAVEEVKSDYIVTYCASCRESMLKGNKNTLHILNLIFDERWTSIKKSLQSTSLMKNWSNRYKVKMGK